MPRVLSQFPDGYPLSQRDPAAYSLPGVRGLGQARVYEGAETGWPPPDAEPQDWLYTLGLGRAASPFTTNEGWTHRTTGYADCDDGSRRTAYVFCPAQITAAAARVTRPAMVMRGLGYDPRYGWGTGALRPVRGEPGRFMPDAVQRYRRPPDWRYHSTAVPGLSRLRFRSSAVPGLRGLGDDTPDSIRLYVPRLASGMHALQLYDTGLMYGALATKPFESAVWTSDLATEFAHQAQRYLKFVPVVHEPEGAQVIFAHMLGAENHTEAERIWQPLQAAINRARTATGTPVPADPTANQPRAWEEAAPAPPPPPEMPPPGPPPMPGVGGDVLGLLSGAAMVIASLIL